MRPVYLLNMKYQYFHIILSTTASQAHMADHHICGFLFIGPLNAH